MKDRTFAGAGIATVTALFVVASVAGFSGMVSAASGSEHFSEVGGSCDESSGALPGATADPDCFTISLNWTKEGGVCPDASSSNPWMNVSAGCGTNSTLVFSTDGGACVKSSDSPWGVTVHPDECLGELALTP